jgi:hypothetical protein
MKKLLISCLLITCACLIAGAQGVSSANTSNEETTSMNFVKFNLTSALIKNYSIQYERILTKDFSAALSFRIMPETGIPYKNQLMKLSDITEPKDKQTIENVLISNYAITPEVRYYMGKKKYGRGFYLSLFYRYGSYNLNNVIVDWESEDEEVTEVNISADVKAHTGGLMIGSQWALGKYMCLDWWIMGPHFGVSSSDVLALSSETMDMQDQQDVKDELSQMLDDADIPMLKYNISTTSDEVKVKLDGPWGGLRIGISLGVKF